MLPRKPTQSPRFFDGRRDRRTWAFRCRRSSNFSRPRLSRKVYESKEGTAKSVIYIFMPGGMAHQETFDPKPFAPVEYRGPFGSIETNVPGVRVNEHLKQTAKIADKITICRSMTHGEAAHERGTHNMFTGYRPSPALVYPSFGSVVSHEFGPRADLPPYVCIPSMPNIYAGTGYLSSSFGAFSLGDDPAREGFKVRDLQRPGDVDDDRFGKRRKMLDIVNDHFRKLEKSDALDAVDTNYQRAYALISSQKAREAFDIGKEKPDGSRRVRPQRGRRAHAARAATGRSGRALRHADLRRLGSSRQHRRRHEAASCRRSTRPSPR